MVIKRKYSNPIHINSMVSFLIVLMLMNGCKKDYKKDGKDYDCNNSNYPGYATIERDGAVREYILFIPSNYNEESPTSLIINFHGYGGCASYFSENVGDLNALAESENFIIAYPQAIVGEKGDVYWNPYDNGIQDIGKNDIFFIEQLISEINNDYNIDLSRVYAIGYSNGGMMAYGLACSKGELFAAIGIMSGIMLPESCSGNEYTSVIHFHGIADDVLPYYGNQDYQSVQNTLNFWIDHNGISESSLVSTNLNNGNVTKDLYFGGNNNTSVALYTIRELNGKPGGHIWFTGEIEGESPNKILWDFLSTYSLND